VGVAQRAYWVSPSLAVTGMNDGPGDSTLSDPATEAMFYRLRRLLKMVPPPPVVWVIAVGFAALVSAVEVRADGETMSATFRVTAITVTLIALTWLPVVVKVYTLVGGTFKTPAGEASSPGLIDVFDDLPPDARRAALASATASTELVMTTATGPKLDNATAVHRELQQQWTTLPPPEAPSDRLTRLTKQYEDLRRTLRPGSGRTLKMSALVAEARSIVRQGGIDQAAIERWLEGFKQATEGKRVIGLALIQESHEPARFYSAALDAVEDSRSAFEQYHALRALERMVADLNQDQRAQLAAALEDQRSGGERKYITPDSDRWPLSSRLLAAIRSPR
jgi:hypothetical protein